ncbi:MAG: bifunctional phosphopantothenoylcysteine decarboxylase/phosphopantothenate--cysteine ligase CoaBC [Actinomycetota bacterium]|nr:bifunctional phosphopantothenoylcysteine decarboxylase/phosphopantothenate--cysteine ligase CoaBC [Actinomycetota bacterium]
MARILLGVSGGIAAYKAVEVVRLATAAGHSVRVIQTPASRRFVGAATFEGVTGAPVLVDQFERDPARGAFPGDPASDHDPISHLESVRRCDAFAVAPASANTLAKLATGLADNLLSSAALANTAPLVLAPAMNSHMWEHPATRANLDLLRVRGARVVEPATGRLASEGEWGLGRLAEAAEVLAAVEAALGSEAPSELLGRRVLVTAGGTREPIDPVRFVGNRSSGRMGLALAAEAARRGAEVTLIAANVSLPAPEGARVVEVSTAAELASAARGELASADVLLMAAAVSDFRPVEPGEAKLKKAGSDGLRIELEPTEDVLAALSAARRPGQTLVGFAAEHGGEPLAEARRKLHDKGVDAVVLNDVSGEGIGFEASENQVTVVTADGERPVARAAKAEVAASVLDEVERLCVRSANEAGA